MTSIKNIQENIMKHLKIKNHKKVYYQYMIDDPHFINFVNNRNINYSVQKGGKKDFKITKINYTYNNKNFVFYEAETKEGHDLAIHRKDKTDLTTCLHIQIDKNLHIAYIQHISYYPDCVKLGLDFPGGGSVLLGLCIKFLKDNKNKYNIKKIQLKDNSYFLCNDNKKRIRLPIMFTLVFGTTWYGKYGFRPYDPDEDSEDKILSKKFDSNQKIVKTTKVKETKLFEYLINIIKEEHVIDSEIQKSIKDYYNNKKNLTINEFFKLYLLDFQNSCAVFSKFYREFFDSLDLYDFTGKSFYLDL